MFAIRKFALLAVVAVAACASNPAPRSSLPKVKSVGAEPFGAYVVAERTSKLVVQGELIAASSDTMWVLHQQGLSALSRDDLRRATVALFDSRRSTYGTLVALGTLATVSNGVFLVFTAPMWLIGGIGTTSTLSRQPLYKWDPQQPLLDLAPYARYPGGIPETLERSLLILPEKFKL